MEKQLVLPLIGVLHPQALEEVLKTMNLESLRGFDLDLPAILRLFEPRKVLENYGIEAVIETFGTEKVVQTLLSSLSDEEKKRLIEQIRQSHGNDGKAQGGNAPYACAIT